MDKKHFYFLIMILILSISMLAFVHLKTDEFKKMKNDANVDITENIRLYSNGKLIGEWEGIGRGNLEGDTYVFTTDRGSFANKIRIKGDFVVETQPN